MNEKVESNTLPESWEVIATRKAAEQAAQRAATSEGNKFISFKSGVMTVDKTPVPGNELEVIVLCTAQENTWYKYKFDPTKPQTPACWAVYTNEVMEPDASAEDKQAADCRECAKFKWGSDPQGGRGKACKTRTRIALISGTTVTVDEVLATELRFATLPVTSGKDFDSFVSAAQLKFSRPPFGVVAKLKVFPDAKSQYKVTLEPVRPVHSELMLSIIDRVNIAERAIMYEYSASEDSDAKPLK